MRDRSSVEVALNGILNIPWLYSQDRIGIYRGQASEHDDGFSFSLPVSTDSLGQGRDGVVRSLLQSILFGMNWTDYAGDPGHLERLLRSEYRYNFWGDPAALQI